MAEKKKKILVVEDDADSLALIQHFLKDAGYDMIYCRRGDDAYQLTMEEKPDLAIIDGLIPGIHGFELCVKIKEEPALRKKPKIIIMSSVYTAQKYKFEVAGYKADAFMLKPFSRDDLMANISAMLG